MVQVISQYFRAQTAHQETNQLTSQWIRGGQAPLQHNMELSVTIINGWKPTIIKKHSILDALAVLYLIPWIRTIRFLNMPKQQQQQQQQQKTEQQKPTEPLE